MLPQYVLIDMLVRYLWRQFIDPQFSPYPGRVNHHIDCTTQHGVNINLFIQHEIENRSQVIVFVGSDNNTKQRVCTQTALFPTYTTYKAFRARTAYAIRAGLRRHANNQSL